MTTTQADFFASVVAPVQVSGDEAVRDELIAVVERDWAGHGRSLQREPGPSEVGAPCARQIAAKIAGAPKTNVGHDIFPSWAGTACHASLEQAFIAENARLVAEGKPERWITERRLLISDGLAGTADLFDLEAGRVVDNKFPGPAAFKKYVKDGPSELYRRQAALYGYGYAQAGFAVNEVAIWFVCRSGQFSKSHVWSEPYNEALALETIERLGHIRTAVAGIGAADDHQQLDRVPAVNTDGCRFCDFYSAAPIEGVWTCQGR